MKRLTTLRWVGVCLLLLFLSWPVSSAEGPLVLFVKAIDNKYIFELTSQFEQTLLSVNPRVAVLNYSMRTEADLIERVKSSRPDLIVALGRKSVTAVAKYIDGVPLIFTGIMKTKLAPEVKARGGGVLFDVPLSLQVEYLQKIMPAVKTVGIIYNEVENSGAIKEAERILGEAGIILRKFAVSSVKEIKAIKRFHVNALIVIPDSIVCQPVVLKRLLKTGLRQRVPVVGISPAYTRAGALLALAPNHKEIGVQLAELAGRILAGEEVGAIPIMPLRKVDCFINQAVARHLDIKIPQEVIREAAEVFGR